MSDAENEDLLNELKVFASSFAGLEPAERGAAFSEMFTLERIEALVTEWERDEFQFDALMDVIASVRGFSGKVRSIQQTIKRARVRAQRAEQQDTLQALLSQSLFSEALPDYLVEGMPTFLVPPGYKVDLGGVYAISAGEGEGAAVTQEKVCSAPFIIRRRGRDVETGEMQLEVAWVELPGPGRGRPTWRYSTVSRSTIFDARQLVGLIGRGAPVTSVTVNECVKWMTAFEDSNQHKIPLTNGANRLGWQHDKSFLLPDGHIRLDAHQELKLFPQEGMQPVMDSLRCGGTWEGWLETISLLREHPLAMLAIYASVASVLQPITMCKNFAVDWSAETTKGKTTSLRVAASVWGFPAEDDDDGFIYSWDHTKVWAERTASFLHNLPLILDETKRVKDKQAVADTVYDFCFGRAKGRGTLQGVKETQSWRSVLLSTGEQRLTSFTQDGGTRGRVLAMQGAPITGPAQTARVVADTVNSRLITHYGHLGRLVVKYLVFHHESWDSFREAFETRRNAYASMTNTGVGGRLSSYVAAIDLAKAVCETLGVPTPTVDPLSFLIQAVRDGAEDSDRARDAFVGVASWAALNRHRMWGSKAAMENGYPGNGWAGRWDDVDPNWDAIDVDVHSTMSILDRYGYAYADVARQWKARGWLHSTQRDIPRSRRIDGIPTLCVSLRRDVYEEIIHVERPDIAPARLQPAQVDLLDKQVNRSSSAWHTMANDD